MRVYLTCVYVLDSVVNKIMFVQNRLKLFYCEQMPVGHADPGCCASGVTDLRLITFFKSSDFFYW